MVAKTRPPVQGIVEEEIEFLSSYLDVDGKRVRMLAKPYPTLNRSSSCSQEYLERKSGRQLSRPLI